MAMVGPAGGKPDPAKTPLPPLRQELHLVKGVDARGETWTLHDPVTGKFFRIDPVSWALLRHWSEGTPEAVIKAAGDKGVSATVKDVLALCQFLRSQFLTVPGPADRDRMLKAQKAMRLSLDRVLQQYLFFKIPVFRPERLLDVLYPLFSFCFKPLFWQAVALLTLVALWLVARQWDVFLATVPRFLGVNGILAYGAVIVASKAVHELAHALALRHYGLRVPSIGVAILMFMPLLYTDASESWRAPSSRARMAIAGAGILSELLLASLATLGWLLADDGAMRDGFFVLATTNWVSTVIFNMNPLMRFDGYFILSDALQFENLQGRAFAQVRKLVAGKLFSLPVAGAETFPPAMTQFLVVFGVATFIYRISVITGIAVLVYTFFFKALGILLLAHQMYKSVFLPLKKGGMWMKKQWPQARLTAWFWLLAALLAGGAALALTPIAWEVSAKAVMVAQERSQVYAPEDGVVAERLDAAATEVARGQKLFVLSSPALDYELELARHKRMRLAEQLAVQGFDAEQKQNRLLAMEEIKRLDAAIANAEKRRALMTVTAPQAGRVDWPAERVTAGQAVGRGMLLAVVSDPSKARVIAYVTELDRQSVSPGQKALFYADGLREPFARAIPAVVVSVGATAAKELSEPALDARFGGPVVTQSAERPEPASACYRVELAADLPAGAAFAGERRGAVRIEGVKASAAARLWRKVLGVLVRESVF
ncbi:MAG: HlyD family efflux transporter periplasmic adaptor subunit [Duodenibacillus sp.]|nr:HlyD family efflux transporter periplasmic adaptor subunit [Duodenibacillus sp.]